MRTALKQAIGPGLIMAGAAIGVSHLVQSTRAGADYGTSLIPLILLACLFKYPFLEFGPRYAAATGESMLVGLRRLGRWALGLFALFTLSTLFVIVASIVLVTAGLASVVLNLSVSPAWSSLGVLLTATVVLSLGQYRGLDLTMKVIMGLLMASTLVATLIALGQPNPDASLDPLIHWDAIWTSAGIAFVLALLGWMPIPLDVAVWHSLWTLERAKQTHHHPSVKDAVFDFKVGYVTATVSAVVFVLLGAAVMNGTGVTFPNAAVAFSETLIGLYTQTLGEGYGPLIGLAALSAMFSTTLAVMDAYPRVLHGLWRAFQDQAQAPQTDELINNKLFTVVLVSIGIGALTIIIFLGQQFTRLIDFATTVSFLSAPILGWLSLRLITRPWVSKAHQPSIALQALAWIGLVFLVGFCMAWSLWRWD